MGVLSLLKNLKITTSSSKRPRVISKSNTNESSSTSQWIYETVKGSHEFKIQGYSVAKGLGVGKSMTSGRFTVGGHDWVLVFYPHGRSESCKEYVSVYIKLVSPTQVTASYEIITASYEIKLLDQTGKGIHSLGTGPKSPIKCNKESCSWRHRRYMKISELETSSFLKDDCLSIHCTVETVQAHSVIPVRPSDMIQNLKDLLKSQLGTDVTFQIGNEFFRAHKLILAARSPVFRAMFFGSVGNPDMDTVAIEEFDPLAFKAMLLFLYSDELPETRELSDSDSLCTSTAIMQHLLAAADRFDLARLRSMCEAKLCAEITANTVATTLALAEQHRCLQLKNVCLNFATKPENLGEVVKSDGFASLEKSCPSLLIDLTPRVISKCNTNHEMSSESQLIYETVKGSHEFKIKRYSLSKGIGVGKSKISGRFTVGGHDWVLVFYPDGQSKSDEEFVSLYISLVSPATEEVRALYEFKLLDQTGNGIHSLGTGPKSPKAFDKQSCSWYVYTVRIESFSYVSVRINFRGREKYMKRSELETSSYLKDDRLSIHCTVEVVLQARVETMQTRLEEGKHYGIPVPPSDMIQNLKGLLESKIGFDVKFQVGNESFRAHKLILAARSSVFRAMFFGLVGNRDMETVIIEEFDPFAFK
ncbi:hypothetical protein MKW92_006687, partial [Papaver armeniacum]